MDDGGTVFMVKILLVDDDPLIVRSLSKTLEMEGYYVECALSGKDALDKIPDGYELVIVDMKMPDWTGHVSPRAGLNLITEIQSRSPKSKIVILTAGSTDAYAVEAMKSGVFDYIVKGSLSRDKFINVIEQALSDQDKTHLQPDPESGNKTSSESNKFKVWFLKRTKGITDEVVAGLIVTLIIYVVGRAIGVLSGTPKNWFSTREPIIYIFVALLLGVILIIGYIILERHFRGRRK